VPDLGVPVVEDAAHAHGALSETGTAIATAYSFYPTKNLGGFGDGGAVVTDDPELAQRVARLRVHGRCEGSEDGEFCEIATNSRVSELEAAALRVGLGGLEARNRRRTEIACAYREAVPEARWQSHHPGHAYHLCVLRVEGRDRFRAAVPFGTAVHYPRAVPDEPAYRRFERDGPGRFFLSNRAAGNFLPGFPDFSCLSYLSRFFSNFPRFSGFSRLSAISYDADFSYAGLPNVFGFGPFLCSLRGAASGSTRLISFSSTCPSSESCATFIAAAAMSMRSKSPASEPSSITY